MVTFSGNWFYKKNPKKPKPPKKPHKQTNKTLNTFPESMLQIKPLVVHSSCRCKTFSLFKSRFCFMFIKLLIKLNQPKIRHCDNPSV